MFEQLVTSENIAISILAMIVLSLSSVVVFQWKHANTKTVPKWVFDIFADKIDKILEISRKQATVLEERLPKR